MTPGDIAAWVAAIIAGFALIISCCSATLSWKSLYWEKVSAVAATRSAEAAERANRFTEETVLKQSLAPWGIPSEEAFGMSGVAPAPNVSWSIENPEKNRYVLRNTGTDVAEHVEVDPSQVGTSARNLPQDAVIRPGEGTDMLLLGTWQRPLPNQLYVRWAGQPDWVAVPLP